ncbi:MAG: 6-pyruvoyl-tetrahydropterin synthase-related protein [Chloroflexota bacterium]
MLRRLKKLDWGLLIAAFLPLMVVLPTWGEGIAAGADVEVHVHRIHAMSLALQEGTLYPRWITYLHMGYGYPIFNFYAPLSAYVTALFELTGLHITVAYNLVQTLAWSFGSVGMYLLTRRFFPAPVAVLAAASWTFAPSRLYEVWWQGSIAQILAASFIPYLLLGVVKNSISPTRRTILAIGIPYAALIMTHTPMMYISTLYAAPLAFFAPMFYAKGERYSQQKWQGIFYRWIMIFGGFALGIGLSAIFLFPTLLELQYVDISNGIDETVNYLQEQFLPPTEIFALPRLIDQTDLYLDFPRTLGLVGGLLSALGIVALVRDKRFGVLALLTAGLGFTIYMLMAGSFDTWMTIPAFANLRFPARLLRIGAVLIAMLGGASLLLLPERYRIAGMVAGVLVVFAQVVPINKPYDVWLTWDDISAFDELLHEYEDRTWGTVSYDEFNPIWGETIYFDMPSNPETYIDNPFQIRVFARDTEGLEVVYLDSNIAQIETEDSRTVRFRQYYFPGWEVRVDGETVDAYPDDFLGLISVDLPAGESTVELNYVGTTTQFWSSVLSLVCAVIALGMYRLGEPDPSKARLAETTSPISTMTGLLCIIGIVAIAVFNVRVMQANNWFKFASPPTEPFYMSTPIDATFGNDEQIRLLGYTLHDTAIDANGTLDIDLYWHVPESITGNYRPVVQLVNLTQSEAWATSSRLQPAAGETSTFSPERFARDPYSLRLFSNDIPAYVGQISVQMISSEDGALPLADGSDRLILPDIIQVNTSDDTFPTTDNIAVFGDVAELACVSVEPIDGGFNLTLGWDIVGTTDSELVVMVHGLYEGNVLANGDGAPFGGNYPSQFWQRGQRLLEQRTLSIDAPIETIAITLYTRDTLERLHTRYADTPLANNQYVVGLGTQTCAR